MPIYEYKCDNGHVFDVIQKMSDEPLGECQECGAPARRVLHPVAIHFKGSGFHNTDYKTKRSGNGAGAEGSKDSGESKGSESATSSGSSGSGSSDASSKSSDSKSGDSKAPTGS
ncbi:MAG TPA: FmdB family zinc ribbon protein [Solirubrobacterales bacterium]|jgi:putative FmdB family regulatory protein